jgi:methylated-DNA-protein-cysteine methyltransferase related protein
MTVNRAAEVAEVLWELKKEDKIATYGVIASRAGFSAGSKGRSVLTALKGVRRDWPHLQWFRAVSEEGAVEKDSEHETLLRDIGFDFEEQDELMVLIGHEERLKNWEEEPEEQDEE